MLHGPQLSTILQVESQESRVEGQNHLSHPVPHDSFDAGQDDWLSGLQVHIASWGWVFQQPIPQGPSPQGCSQFILCPACMCASDCPSPGSGSCTCPCWTSRGLHRPTSQACQIPYRWHLFPPECWLYQKVQCLGFTQSHCPCHW